MDMIVPLYRLPSCAGVIEDLHKRHGVLIRPIYTFERSLLRAFIEQNFTRGWADEAEMGFRHMPPSCLIAMHENQIVGFAAYDCTFNGFFGPTGVLPAQRGKGIGKALLLASLEGLKTLGYAYAIIGSVGPKDFYSKTVHAIEIPDSTPGPYQNMLESLPDTHG